MLVLDKCSVFLVKRGLYFTSHTGGFTIFIRNLVNSTFWQCVEVDKEVCESIRITERPIYIYTKINDHIQHRLVADGALDRLEEKKNVLYYQKSLQFIKKAITNTHNQRPRSKIENFLPMWESNPQWNNKIINPKQTKTYFKRLAPTLSSKNQNVGLKIIFSHKTHFWMNE